MTRRGQEGFALALILAVLPALSAGVLLTSALIGITQSDLAMKYQCREHGQDGQRKVAPLLSRLLALNPLAQQLRLQQLKELQNIATATAAKNPVALAAATKRYLATVKKREHLDAKQRQLINQANFSLGQTHSLTSRQIRSAGAASTNSFLKIQLTSLKGRPPRLAVHPNQSDLAPVYSPAPDFDSAQALAHEWHYRTIVSPPFSYFLPGDFNFTKACAVTLKKEKLAWIPAITRGRFSSKSVW